MEKRSLGESDLAITAVGIGTAPIGSSPGTWWVNWGPQDEGDAVRAIHAALDVGVNWIDTAPFYGWGRAEEIVGRAIHGRDGVLVFTKCGTLRRPDGSDYERLRAFAELTPAEVALLPATIQFNVPSISCEQLNARPATAPAPADLMKARRFTASSPAR